MEAFIIRPFGTKNDIDFEKVEQELIRPALLEVGITAVNTGNILEAGNIRQDIFQLLLTADVVIADISIHNANVFYELGIRHALREKLTFLIRTKKDDVPFDLKTDSYLSYDYPNVSKQKEKLSRSISASLNSEQQDSPVYLMLPMLKSQNPENFLSVPQDFGEEVEIAKTSGDLGKLAVLAQEAADFPWAIPGLRLIGEVEFSLNAFEHAQETWEKVREAKGADKEADDRLATIYERLARKEIDKNPTLGIELFAKSNLAIERLLECSAGFSSEVLAEIHSLRGRNAKIEWENSWKDEENKSIKALTSGFLVTSYKHYAFGFRENINHYYPGINALGLLTVIISLAKKNIETWELLHTDQEEANQQLISYEKEHAKLLTVVEYSLKARDKKNMGSGIKDVWLDLTKGEFACLTENQPERVKILYERACEGASNMAKLSAQKQLKLYHSLDILDKNVEAALSVFEPSLEELETQTPHYILFTGHMIDDQERKNRRFPAEIEDQVKKAIRKEVEQEKNRLTNIPICGLAGGACGGDILFHEICQELNIPSELLLALPSDKFVKESVNFAGQSWTHRFEALYKKLPVRILSNEKKLPKWLRSKDDSYTIWERNNLWLLHSALINGGDCMNLIALWDEEEGDKTGGTEHMVNIAVDRGAKVKIINPIEIINK